MRIASVPRLDPLYWLTLALASIFGTNTGDVISHTFKLGDYQGLPVLALMFGAVLVAERHARVPGPVYYWLAIIVLRTAATNLADLSTLQWELSYQSVIAALAVLLAAILAAGRWLRPATREPAGIPSSDAAYWVAMLAAATLGTALGDFGSHTLTLRGSALVSVTLLALAFVMVRHAGSDTVRYWCTIVMARAAGTNVADLLAFRKGLNLGLPASTLATGLVFFGVVLLGDRWRRNRWRQPVPRGV